MPIRFTLIKLILTASFVLILIMIAINYGLQRADLRRWEVYSTSNHCRPFSYEKGYTMYSSNGTIISVPDRTTYACDNGTFHTRPTQ